MQRIVAGLMAITAMGASILADVDPVGTVVRGGVAFLVGMVLAGIWTMAVDPESVKKKEKKRDSEPAEESSKDEKVESNESDEEESQEEAA